MSQRVEFAQKTACEKVEERERARFNGQVRGNFNRRKRAYDKDMLLRICCRTCMRTRLPILVPRGAISLFLWKGFPIRPRWQGNQGSCGLNKLSDPRVKRLILPVLWSGL